MSELVRDFDAERQERYERSRKFKIGGETLTFHRGLRPEAFSEITAAYNDLTLETPPEEAIRIMDETIAAFLESDADREKWATIRAREEQAITARDMRDVLGMIFEEQTGRPTESPEPSSNGAGGAGEILTESSSSDLEASEVSAG